MKILLTTDGSEFSRAAVEECCRIIAKPGETKVKIVSVIQEVVPLDAFAQSAESADKQEQAAFREAEAFVAEAAGVIRSCFPDSGLEVTTEVLKGASDRTLLETAKEWNAEIIVVGSHGRGFWGRLTLGSITDSLVHHAPCSVLVVRQSGDPVDGGN